MKHNICAVFDIDDTLYLERDYVISGYRAVGRWAAEWLRVEDFGDRCWRAFAAGRRKGIFDSVLGECGLRSSTELISALVAIYRTHRPAITLATDAYEAIARISRVASIAIISDGPAASQSRKADALHLGAFAEPVILTELLGPEFAKPHPRAFEQVQASLAADHYIYIADNPLKDFSAPQQLGWTTVRVRRPDGLHYHIENHELRPDYEMPDCLDLPVLLANL